MPADLDSLFGEVIAGTFEWAYHSTDNAGIKMAAYDFHAIGSRHGGDLSATIASGERSRLAQLKERGS